MTTLDLQAQFVRRLEARYAMHVERHLGEGLEAESAHRRAFMETKEFGRQVLDELRRRHLFPWRADGAETSPQSDAMPALKRPDEHAGTMLGSRP